MNEFSTLWRSDRDASRLEGNYKECLEFNDVTRNWPRDVP